MFVNACMVQENDDVEQENISVKEAKPSSETEILKTHLVAVGKDQNRASFTALFEHFAPRIKSFLMRGGLDDAGADELAQEVMIAIWQKAGQYDPAKAAPSTWIFTIVRNKRIDALRKIKGYHFDIDDAFDLEDDGEAPDARADARQEAEIVKDMLSRLNEDQRALVYKSFFEGKTHAEIAEETQLPLGTVKSRIRLALKKLENLNILKKLRGSYSNDR